MGTYISQSDIEDVYGVANVAQWSVIEPTGDPTTANTTRTAAAITYAESYVEDRMRASRYAVPMSASGGSFPPVVKDWMARLAGVWLYESRAGRGGSNDEDSPVTGHRAAVSMEINAAVSGMQRLNLALNYAATPSAPTVV